jgi:predicted RNase H-like HicB family nuclease
MQTYTFRVIIEPDEKNSFHGYVPILRGCHTWGKTLEETKKNLKEAIKCHIQGLLKDGQNIPREENTLELVQTFTDKELALSC